MHSFKIVTLIALISLIMTIFVSCVKFTKIEYTGESPEFSASSQNIQTSELSLPVEEKTTFSSLDEFKKYIDELNASSLSSYESVVSGSIFENDALSTELSLQESIISQLLSVEIPYKFILPEKRVVVKNYIQTTLPELIKGRIQYISLIKNNSGSLSEESDLIQLKTLTIPMLENITKQKFSEF